jgi:hypothetical protein
MGALDRCYVRRSDRSARPSVSRGVGAGSSDVSLIGLWTSGYKTGTGRMGPEGDPDERQGCVVEARRCLLHVCTTQLLGTRAFGD